MACSRAMDRLEHGLGGPVLTQDHYLCDRTSKQLENLFPDTSVKINAILGIKIITYSCINDDAIPYNNMRLESLLIDTPESRKI